MRVSVLDWLTSIFLFPVRWLARRTEGAKRRIAIAVLLIAAPVSFFYLFVVPALTAINLHSAGIWASLFGAFLYLQLWLLVLEYWYVAVAHLYGFARKSILLPFFWPGAARKPVPSIPRGGVAFFALLSYAVTIYGYAVAYTAISALDASAFSDSAVSLGDGLYLSALTIATVSFGDIVPRTPLARVVTVSEVIVGVGFAISVFSMLAAYLRERRDRQEPAA